MEAISTDGVLQRYAVSVRFKGGSVVMLIPELGVSSVGGSVDEAMAKLRQRLDTLLADLEVVDLVADLPSPGRAAFGGGGKTVASHVVGGTPWWDLRGFLLRLAVVGLMAGVGLGIVATTLNGAVSRAEERLTARLEQIAATVKINPRAFWGKLDEKLAAWASPDRDLSPEKRAELLERLHVLVDRAKPFVDELRPLVWGTPAEKCGK